MPSVVSLSTFFHTYPRAMRLFLMALLVRLCAFLFLFWWFKVAGHLPEVGGHFPIIGGDSADFAQLSENLFYHGTFSSSAALPLIPESFRLPGYSFFLYPFFFLPYPLFFGVLAQIICASASVVLTYLLGRKYLGEQVGYFGALLMAFEPTTVFNSVQVLSDSMFVFVMLLSLYLLFKTANSKAVFFVSAVLSGLLFGYAVLVRVIVQYLAFCILPLYVLFFRNGISARTALLRVLIFIVCAVAVIAPWSIRNHAQFGTYTISSTPYINFTQYNLVYFYAYQHHVTPPEVQYLFSDPIPYPTSSLWFRSLINEPIFLKEMHDGLSGNILPYAFFHLYKTIPFFITDSLRDINLNIGVFPQQPQVTNFTDLLLHRDFTRIFIYFMTPTPDLFMLLLGSSVWITISGLCFFSIFYAVFTRKKEVWFILLLGGSMLYFAVLSSPVIQPRYRVPAAPFMLLLASYSATILFGCIKRNKPVQLRSLGDVKML